MLEKWKIAAYRERVETDLQNLKDETEMKIHEAQAVAQEMIERHRHQAEEELSEARAQRVEAEEREQLQRNRSRAQTAINAVKHLLLSIAAGELSARLELWKGRAWEAMKRHELESFEVFMTEKMQQAQEAHEEGLSDAIEKLETAMETLDAETAERERLAAKLARDEERMEIVARGVVEARPYP